MTGDARPESEVPQTVSEIVCVDCETAPRLKSLDKNHGTQTMCDCDGPGKSMDAVPYELGVNDLPESWVVIDGRTPKQMAKEVDAMIESGAWKCERCGAEFAHAENCSCAACGYIPEEHRA